MNHPVAHHPLEGRETEQPGNPRRPSGSPGCRWADRPQQVSWGKKQAGEAPGPTRRRRRRRGMVNQGSKCLQPNHKGLPPPQTGVRVTD